MKTILAALLVLLVSAGSVLAVPPDEDGAMARLNGSPRHGEWVRYNAGGGDMVDAYVVYPERSDAAPVVIVIHEIFGLSDWVRSVADEFAAEGFIAIAPDFLSGKGPQGGGSSEVPPDEVRGMIRSLERDEIIRRLDAAAAYATALPAASDRYGVVGYCWGGAISFDYATAQPELAASVVFYGTSPETATLSNVEAPVLGLYGENDNRVNATIPDAEREMERLGKAYEVEILSGAGHGFLRNQAGQDGANGRAARQAWPRTVQFFKQHLEGSRMMYRPDGTPKAMEAAQSSGWASRPLADPQSPSTATMVVDMGACLMEEPGGMESSHHGTMAQTHH